MVGAFAFRSSGLGSRSGLGHCVVFLTGQGALLSQCLSPPRCANALMVTGELNATG